MKFTLTWLKDYLDTAASAAEIADKLTAIGLELESMEDMDAKLSDFVVAKIEDAQPHPDADKLRVCKVNDGAGVRQIVCGAPNARAGIYVVLAREGVCIPANGMTIKQAKIRGVESNGMLCSFEELGMAGDSSGIVELSGEPQPGSSATKALGMDDVVFDIAITPNRGDCFSVYGIARDLAAAGIGTLKPVTIPQITEKPLGSNPPSVKVVTETPNCPEFAGVTVSGVKNGASPAWLKQRLELVGQKSISALVDVTNYIMLTFGRPLHAYDVRMLSGTVTARQARDGEKLNALNGEEYTLSADMVVISDEQKALGIAGVMGSEHSGCQDDTTEVLIESALFDAVNIAMTGQKLNLTSDARMRFERGVDSAFVQRGAELAAHMIMDICGGEASALQVAGGAKSSQNVQNFTPAMVKRYTSLEVSSDKCKNILTSLGFAVDDSGDMWKVTAPYWRHDIEGSQDLVEEVARIVGYDHIAPAQLDSSGSAAAVNPMGTRLKQAKKLLAAEGLTELHNWTFYSEKQAKTVGELNPALVLANPISSDLSIMRSSLLPHLLSTAERNLNKGVADIAVFEVGQVYFGAKEDEQKNIAAVLLAGQKTSYTHSAEHFAAKNTAYDFYDAKAYAMLLLSSFGMDPQQVQLSREAPDYFHPGRSVRMSLGGKITLGYAGELHPATLETYGVDGRAAYMEIDLAAVPMPKKKTTAKKPLSISPYPSVDRDFAFTVDANVEVEQLRRAAMKADKKLVKSASVFDVYQGSHMEAGKKSVALRVVLESAEKTLTDEEIQNVASAVIEQVSGATGAVLRQ